MTGGVENFPVTLQQDQVVGRLSAGAGPTEAIPMSTLAALTLARLSDVSSTSITMTTGSVTLLVSPNKAFSAGQPVTVAYANNPAQDYMSGIITSYNVVTGQLVFNAQTVVGSGTFTSWFVNVTGAQGPAGAQGTQGNPGVAGTALVTPQGRLSLSSTNPVPVTTFTGATAVYYLPYNGSVAPYYNGTSITTLNIGNGLTMNLDSNSGHSGYQVSGSLFDFFVFNNNGVPTLGTGPAWSSLTSRGTGANTTQLTQTEGGFWTNAVSINLKIDATSTLITVGANQATYVGTMYATANGQTNWQPVTTANGGSDAVLGLYNAYNRVTVRARSVDNTGSWTYATATWRAANNSANNRICFVDGLQQSHVEASYSALIQGGGVNGAIGSALDWASGAPTIMGMLSTITGTATAREVELPQLGFHFIQAIEYSSGATTTFYGTSATPNVNAAVLTLNIEM